MRRRIKCAVAASIAIALLAAALFWPGLPWSARLRYTARRAAAKFESKVAAWRGQRPRPVSISGKLTGDGALVESLKGARVAAIESTSGYAVLSDGQGGFTLPHLVWYPGATYTLQITADAHHARRFKVRAPPVYPQNGVIDVRELRFDEGVELTPEETLARFLEYDAENRDYYKEVFEKLTAHARTDHQAIGLICKFVATRQNSKEDPWGFKSARQIIERGAPHCSNFAFAMAAITSAGGYPTRTVHTSDTAEYKHTHVAVEVFYEDGWHLYDPTYGVSFVNKAGDVASYKELRLNPALITPEAFGQVEPEIARAALAWMPGAYGSGLHQIYHADESAFR
ncbi:MAG TPA: transglutaminase domain-containing protein [Blastocatellia bacterium]|nr:transglutaminase domain-containing protein [Blastocatellia bacterium]